MPLILTTILTNKYLWIILSTIVIISGIFYTGYKYGKSTVENKEAKVIIREVTKYVKDKEIINNKYSTDKSTDYCVYSGCLTEAAKTNPKSHETCKHCWTQN